MIPKKKNDRKPVSRKQTDVVPQSSEGSDLQSALIKALLEEPVNETSDQEETKRAGNKDDRSKMWQQTTTPSSTSLSSKRRKSLKTIEDRWAANSEEGVKVAGHKILWAVGIILGVLLLGCLGLVFRFFITDRVEPENYAIPQQMVESEDTKKRTLAIQIQEATRIIEQYLYAENLDEKCIYIYKAESFRSIIDEYYEKEPWKPFTDISITGIHPIIFDSKEYWQVSLYDAIDGQSFYYLRKDEKGDLLVDWKADVVYQKNDISSFISTKSKEPQLFRCIIDLNKNRSVYNWEFTEDKYFSLKVEIPDRDDYVWGYMKKNSEVSKKMEQLRREAIINQGLQKSLHKFIVTVKFLKDTSLENNQHVSIENVIANSWVNTEE